MSFSLEGKIALVTGASRGLGAEIADTLAAHGAYVVGTGTSEESAAKITARFAEKGLKGSGEVLNVNDPDAMTGLISKMKDTCGLPLILVNNAGITKDNLMLRMKPEQWDDVISTNLTSVFHLSKLCLRGMIKANWGRIINISSVVGVAGNPGQANYAASKAGVIGFGKSLAQEIASRGITVNAVAPGFIKSDMTDKLSEEQQEGLKKIIPMGECGEPEDIALGVLYLASDAGRYVTGQTLNINGGMFMA